MPDATFTATDLTTLTRLDDLRLVVVGQSLEPDRAVLACRVVEPDQWCRRCGCEGIPRDSLVRRLAHELFEWRPTVRRYRCAGCGHVWCQDTSKAAESRSKLYRRAHDSRPADSDHDYTLDCDEPCRLFANDGVVAGWWRVGERDPGWRRVGAELRVEVFR